MGNPLLAAALLLAWPSALASLTPPASEEALRKEVRAVIDLFYDLRFDQAAEAAERLVERYPGHPAGPFYRGIVAYQRYLQQDGGAQASFAAFELATARAFDAAAAVEGRLPAQSEFYRGAALGFHARALVSARQYASAIPKARRSVLHLKRALALDPSLEDARLGLGMYDYFMSRMPAAAKPFAYLALGMMGNRERGLTALEDVARSSGTARMEARAVLSAIYSTEREGRWAEAEGLLRELTARYPGNPLYRLRLAYVLERRGRHAEAARLADPDGWAEIVHAEVRDKARLAGRLRMAEALLFDGKPEAARAELARVEGTPLPPKLREFLERLRLSFPKPPKEPSRITWPMAGLPSDKKG